MSRFRLSSGNYLDLQNPQPASIDIRDIASGLSKLCRFGGQCSRFYSVAEHCIHAARISIQDGNHIDCSRAVLLHDAVEAYVGDVVRPLKELLPDYRMVEQRVENVIAIHFGLDFHKWAAQVKSIDLAMLFAERSHLFSVDAEKWNGEDVVRRVEVNFNDFPPAVSERVFLEMFHSLFEPRSASL